MTAHARERWDERCSHLDLDEEITASKRASKRMLNHMRQNWERAMGVGTWPAEHTYLVTPGGCLFIVGTKTNAAITVLLIKDIKRWGKNRVMDDRLRRRGGLL